MDLSQVHNELEELDKKRDKLFKTYEDEIIIRKEF